MSRQEPTEDSGSTTHASPRRRGEPIKEVRRKDGSKRYRVRVDAGHHPDGRRRQVMKTFKTKTEARKALAEARVLGGADTYVARTRITVREFLDDWLANREFGHENTRGSYRSDLSAAYERLGHVQLQKLTPQHLNDLKRQLRTTGGRSGTGRSPRTVNLCLGILSTAFDAAVRQRLIPSNPASKDYVERMKEPRTHFDAWDVARLAAFLTLVAQDRYAAAWSLSACGFRRSEVLGLTWDAVDLDAGTVTVRQGRTPRKRKDSGLPATVVADPKSENSHRTVPVPRPVIDQLRTLLRLQRQEGLRRGDPVTGSDFVVRTQVGDPVHPDWYSKQFNRWREQGSLPRIRLHDLRRTAATLLHTEFNVPADSAASYLGHDEATYHRVYVEGRQGHDRVRDALARMQSGFGGLVKEL